MSLCSSQDRLNLDTRVYFWNLNLSIYLSLCLHKLSWLLLLYIKFKKIWSVNLPILLFFIRVCFPSSESVEMPYEFLRKLSISSKTAFQILIETALNMSITLGNTAILTMLNFPINEHGMFFYWFRSLIFQYLFLEYEFYTHTIKFITKYCIHFDTIVNEIIFLISFSDHSLEVHRNWVNFIYWSSMLQSCWTHVLVLIDFEWIT